MQDLTRIFPSPPTGLYKRAAATGGPRLLPSQSFLDSAEGPGGLTYIKELLGGGDGDSAQGILVFLVNHFVTVHSLSFMQPEAHEVCWAFQNLCCGEQESLPPTQGSQCL